MFPVVFVLALSAISVLGVPSPLKYNNRFLPGGRIIGGRDADISDYPYQVSLFYKAYGAFCGGSLISPNYVLTASHCTYGVKPSEFLIRAGSSYANSGGQVVQVEKVIEHKDFSYGTAENDITLLKLAVNVTTVNATTISLAQTTPAGGAAAIVTGWGVTDNDGYEASEILQVVEVPIVSLEDCRDVYSRDAVADTMLCAGYLEKGGKDACAGDSGGPLVVDGAVAGIVSWGHGCALPKSPGVYTNVASYLDWISENMV